MKTKLLWNLCGRWWLLVVNKELGNEDKKEEEVLAKAS
jgi:hypothetical protein